jgi:hypothetical protein
MDELRRLDKLAKPLALLMLMIPTFALIAATSF